MFRYTALGDSITAGFGASSPYFTYTSKVVSIVHTRSGRASGDVLAESGWTSADLDAAVVENPVVFLTNAQAISVWIGGDNLIHAALRALSGGSVRNLAPALQQALAGYGRDLAVLVTGIRRVSKARLVLCTQYNPFPNTPLAGEAIAALNGVTEKVAGACGAVVAPTQNWFSGHQAELIAGYTSGRIQDVLQGRTPIHPNDRGHATIAANLAPLLM